MTTYEEKSQIAGCKKKNFFSPPSLFTSYDEKADRATAYSTWNGICLSWQLIKGPPHLAQLLGVDTDMDYCDGRIPPSKAREF